MRENMLIYRSFYEAIKDLPLEEQALVWNAIFELGLNQNEVELSGIASTIFKLVKPQVEANIRRFQNGKAPKKQNVTKTEPNTNQTTTKTETNNNINNNLNKNTNKDITTRKTEFYQLLTQFVEIYPREMLRNFYEYWTEHSHTDKKMRFEKEKSFGIERRLKTWEKNQSTFNKTSKEFGFASNDKMVDFVKQQINKQ